MWIIFCDPCAHIYRGKNSPIATVGRGTFTPLTVHEYICVSSPPEGSFPFTSPFLSSGLFCLSFCLYFLFVCIWFQQFRDVRGLSSERSLHMSPIGGVWLGACPKLTELCLLLLLALILPPALGPGGAGEGRWKTARGSTADNFTKFASFTGS